MLASRLEALPCRIPAVVCDSTDPLSFDPLNRITQRIVDGGDPTTYRVDATLEF